MKKFVMWLADKCGVELTKTVEKEKIVYKIIPAEGKILGDVVIEGNVEVQGGMYIEGGLFATKYINAKEGVGIIEAKSLWNQSFDGTASIPTKKVSTKKSKNYGK